MLFIFTLKYIYISTRQRMLPLTLCVNRSTCFLQDTVITTFPRNLYSFYTSSFFTECLAMNDLALAADCHPIFGIYNTIRSKTLHSSILTRTHIIYISWDQDWSLGTIEHTTNCREVSLLYPTFRVRFVRLFLSNLRICSLNSICQVLTINLEWRRLPKGKIMLRQLDLFFLYFVNKIRHHIIESFNRE